MKPLKCGYDRGRPLRTANQSPSNTTRRNLIERTANETKSAEGHRREAGRTLTK